MDTSQLDALFAENEDEALRTRFSDEKLEFFGQGNPLKGKSFIPNLSTLNPGENIRRLFATQTLNPKPLNPQPRREHPASVRDWKPHGRWATQKDSSAQHGGHDLPRGVRKDGAHHKHHGVAWVQL